MALENLVGADKFIAALVPSNPTGGDDKREGDDHIRGIKNALKNTFPNVNGAVTATEGQLNASADIANKVNRTGDTMTGALVITKPGATYQNLLLLESGAQNVGEFSPAITFSASGVHAGIWGRRRSAFGGDLVFGTAPEGPSGVDPIERMRIYPNGSVQIGPSVGNTAPLLLRSDEAGGGYAVVNHGGTDRGYMGVGNNLAPGWSNSDFGLRSNAALVFAAGGNTERMRISATGQVNIGATTIPQGQTLLGGAGTFVTQIPVGATNSGGLLLITGSNNTSGHSFSALYNLAIRTSSGAVPNVTVALINRSGQSADPTITIGDNGAFVTITLAGGVGFAIANYFGS